MKNFSFFLLSLFLFSSLFTHANNGIHFTENNGQWESPILYKATLSSGALFLEKNGFTYNFYNANEYKFHRMLKDGNLDAKLKFHAFKINFLNFEVNRQ